MWLFGGGGLRELEWWHLCSDFVLGVYCLKNSGDTGFENFDDIDFDTLSFPSWRKAHCDQCAARYVSSSALVAHKLSKHTDQADKETFLCNFCGQSFNKKEYFSKHVTKHTGEKPYECKECGKSFRLHGVYKNHMRVHRGTKDYKCAHCEKMFMQRQHLVVHVRRHTGDKRHKCDECGKAFVEPATLRNHLKTHKNLNTNQYLVNQ